jgi:uncharacterized repeat protein (TIGR01451 family)
MNKRSRLAAVLGAGLLMLAMVGTAAADPPTYTIDVSKTAVPATVPVSGGTVTFHVFVHNSGTGDFDEVIVTDPLAGCTLASVGGHPTGPSDKLNGGPSNTGETWEWTCTVAGVTPGTTNTATVQACHNAAHCADEGAQSVGGEGSVTVTLAAGPGGSPGVTGQPTTDTLAPTGDSGPTNAAWLIIAALGVLLGSLVVLSPARIGRRR